MRRGVVTQSAPKRPSTRRSPCATAGATPCGAQGRRRAGPRACACRGIPLYEQHADSQRWTTSSEAPPPTALQPARAVSRNSDTAARARRPTCATRSSAPGARSPLDASAAAVRRCLHRPRPRPPARARRPAAHIGTTHLHALQRVPFGLRGPGPGVAATLPAGAGARPATAGSEHGDGEFFEAWRKALCGERKRAQAGRGSAGARGAWSLGWC
jgi:hypothetical protein